MDRLPHFGGVVGRTSRDETHFRRCPPRCVRSRDPVASLVDPFGGRRSKSIRLTASIQTRGDDVSFEWLASTLLVVVGIGIGIWQYRDGRRTQLLVELQGDKDAVAAVAQRIRAIGLPSMRRRRLELIGSLCVAAVFEKSGRSRSLIYGALSEVTNYSDDVRKIVDEITVTVHRGSAYTDLEHAKRMVHDLRAALRLDSDLRVRIDECELDASAGSNLWRTDPRLSPAVFAWLMWRQLPSAWVRWL